MLMLGALGEVGFASTVGWVFRPILRFNASPASPSTLESWRKPMPPDAEADAPYPAGDHHGAAVVWVLDWLSPQQLTMADQRQSAPPSSALW